MSLEPEKVKRIIEGALFAAGQPMKLDKLANLFFEEERPTTDVLMEALGQLKDEYAERGVELKQVSSGYRFQVKEEVGEWVSRLWEEKPPRYSRALLETLALIAYRQPITRGEIEEIRGVSVSSHITKTLLERDWIRVVGHRDVPGRPAMYGTTRNFLDYFNLENLDELPSLAEIRDLDTINAELELEENGGVSPEPEAGAEVDSELDSEVNMDINDEAAEAGEHAQSGSEQATDTLAEVDSETEADELEAEDDVKTPLLDSSAENPDAEISDVETLAAETPASPDTDADSASETEQNSETNSNSLT
ncbi:MAG: SMC-Scp complex subunit ScpB [Pseudomonadales bacterium]|nr:SMC-Scp complex subunit ScpB [Pseudomonadales bacterium]